MKTGNFAMENEDRRNFKGCAKKKEEHNSGKLAVFSSTTSLYDLSSVLPPASYSSFLLRSKSSDH
jgi:hypothetical protein